MDNGDNLIEQVIVQMRERLVSRDNECEDFLKSIRESREDFDIKLKALTELQMENKIGIRELGQNRER